MKNCTFCAFFGVWEAEIFEDIAADWHQNLLLDKPDPTPISFDINVNLFLFYFLNYRVFLHLSEGQNPVIQKVK